MALRRGIGIQTKNRKKPGWRTNSILAVAIIIVIALLGTAAATQNYLWRFPVSQNRSNLRAVMIDELSMDYPDPSFVNNVSQSLGASGYSVDYVGPSPSAVDSFRDLPSRNYDLIIIRAHTGSSQSIITTQPYSKSDYLLDQLQGRLVAAQVQNGPLYFALTPSFVRQDMGGRFPGSTIILMGCAAMEGTHDLASAFLDKGASLFAGWNGPVTVIHMDSSTATLVERMSAGQNLQFVAATEMIPDPVYGARLTYLDWNELVGNRINNMLPAITDGSLLAVILVFGPLTIFVVPRLSSMLEHNRSFRKPKIRPEVLRD